MRVTMRRAVDTSSEQGAPKGKPSFALRAPAGDASERVSGALRRVALAGTPQTLVVGDGISERIFYFSIGGIRVISAGPRATVAIAEALVATGKLSQEDLLRAMS